MKRAAFFLALLAAVLQASSALAHSVGISNGEYVLSDRTLRVDLSLSQRELCQMLPDIDPDHDEQLDQDELDAARPALLRDVVGGIKVTADGADCPGMLDRARPLEGEAGLVIRAHYDCPRSPDQLGIALPLLSRLAQGHRHLARIALAGKSESLVLDRKSPSWTGGSGEVSKRSGAVFRSMFGLGIEHILTGADHLVFLLGLLIVGGSFRSLVGVVSAFTVAHSLTLALAVLGVVSPSPRLVEPAIALSIAYVGLENLFVKDARKRWRITFPFGLIHGFGFAGALHEVALSRDQIPTALAAFNLGVELGQLGALGLAIPLVVAARRIPRFHENGTKLISSAIALAGAALFVVRTFSPS